MIACMECYFFKFFFKLQYVNSPYGLFLLYDDHNVCEFFNELCCVTIMFDQRLNEASLLELLIQKITPRARFTSKNNLIQLNKN